MTFVNISLLAGTALVALPIILHLIMRRRPTLLEFPALRFLQKRHDVNQRRLQLRHLLLLLLRAGAIALLGVRLGPAERETGRGRRQPGGARGGGPGVRRRPAHGVSPPEPNPPGGRPRAGPLAAEATARTERGGRGGHPARRDGRVPGRSRRGPRANRTAGNGGQLAAAAGGARGREALARKLLRQSHLDRKELYIFTDLSRGGWPSSNRPASSSNSPSWAIWAFT